MGFLVTISPENHVKLRIMMRAVHKRARTPLRDAVTLRWPIAAAQAARISKACGILPVCIFNSRGSPPVVHDLGTLNFFYGKTARSWAAVLAPTLYPLPVRLVVLLEIGAGQL